jgi:hypothetical protein
MGSQFGYIRATCCNPDPCDLSCTCSCCFCTGSSCGAPCSSSDDGCVGYRHLKTCSAGSCGTCYAPEYDMSWVYQSVCREGLCALPTARSCGNLVRIADNHTQKAISYVMITDCGPFDWCTSGVMGELTRGGWYALGHTSMGGTDAAWATW